MARLAGTVALVTGASSGLTDRARAEAPSSKRWPASSSSGRSRVRRGQLGHRPPRAHRSGRARCGDTELFSHVRPEVQARLAERFEGVERLQAGDLAEAIIYIVTWPRRMAVNEMLVRPTEQQL